MLLAFALSLALLAGLPATAAPQAPPPQTQQPRPDPSRVQTFTGTIVHNANRYQLRDEGGKVWTLDSPDRARPFEGRRVRITGRLDPDSTLHVDTIRPLHPGQQPPSR